jgi:hypothetical protein
VPPAVAEFKTARQLPGVSRGFADRIDWERALGTKEPSRALVALGKSIQVAYVRVTGRHSALRGYNALRSPPLPSTTVVVGLEEGTTDVMSQPEALGYTLAWLTPIAQTFHEFRKLGENWDSYGGSPIDPANMAAALAFLWDVIDQGVRLPLPSVSPTSTGGVGLSWRSVDTEVEIAFDPDGDPGILVTQDGHTWDAPLDEAGSVLTAVADRL